MEATLLYPSKDITGEAAIWLEDKRLFLWVDIDSKIMHIYDPKSGGVENIHFSEMPTTITPYKEDKIIIAVQGKLIKFDLNTRTERELCLIEKENRAVRPNDGKCSPDGRLFIGVMQFNDHDKTGALYKVDHDLSITKVLDKQSIPNGIVWNKKGDLIYYADSGRGVIEEYSYNQCDGSIKFNRVAISVPPEMGVPDGMSIDDQDNLWVAHWGGFGVYVWSPTSGKLLKKVNLPVPNVASCSFDNEGHLYITTARAFLNQEELTKYPLSGALFITDVNCKGGEAHYPFKTIKQPL